MDVKLIVESAINRKKLNPLQSDIHEYVKNTFGEVKGQGLAGKNHKSTTWKVGVAKADAPNAIDSAAEHFKAKGWSHDTTATKKFYTDPHKEHIMTRPDGEGTHEILRIAHWKNDAQRDNDTVELYHSHSIKNKE